MNKDTVVPRLGIVALLAIGGSIFAMHFGASCMLWPVTWGRNAGTSIAPAFTGFFLTGCLLPFLAYFAVLRGGGPLFTLANRVGPTFGQLFGGFTVMIMGPLFVIPRMSAAAWDAISKLAGWEASSWVLLFAFTVIYYAITYWFIFRQTEIVDKVSAILVPLLIILEIAIIFKALTNPIGIPVPKFYPDNPFSRGFIDGYQTMDLPAAMMFAGVILVDINARLGEIPDKVKKNLAIAKNLIIGGCIGFLILVLIEMGEFAMGASTGAVFADVDYAKLFVSIVMAQWGTAGGLIFNVALVFAAMTTAIGLTAGTAAYFVDASKGKWGYNKLCIITLVISTLISVCGLNEIVKWTAPILNLIYPPCIALVLFTVFAPKLMGAQRGACILSAAWGIIEALKGYLGLFGFEGAFGGLYSVVPGAEIGFGFAIFFVIGAIIGHFWMGDKDEAPPGQFDMTDTI